MCICTPDVGPTTCGSTSYRNQQTPDRTQDVVHPSARNVVLDNSRTPPATVQHVAEDHPGAWRRHAPSMMFGHVLEKSGPRLVNLRQTVLGWDTVNDTDPLKPRKALGNPGTWLNCGESGGPPRVALGNRRPRARKCLPNLFGSPWEDWRALRKGWQALEGPGRRWKEFEGRRTARALGRPWKPSEDLARPWTPLRDLGSSGKGVGHLLERLGSPRQH